MCIHVPGGAALQEPAGGGPRTRREHRRGARARVSADAAAAATAAAEVHVTEKLQVLEVCVCLKVHRKRFFERFFDKIVVRNNCHKNFSLSIIAIIAISPIIAIKILTA